VLCPISDLVIDTCRCQMIVFLPFGAVDWRVVLLLVPECFTSGAGDFNLSFDVDGGAFTRIDSCGAWVCFVVFFFCVSFSRREPRRSGISFLCSFSTYTRVWFLTCWSTTSCSLSMCLFIDRLFDRSATPGWISSEERILVGHDDVEMYVTERNGVRI
jgi:hypothetical protein